MNEEVLTQSDTPELDGPTITRTLNFVTRQIEDFINKNLNFVWQNIFSLHIGVPFTNFYKRCTDADSYKNVEADYLHFDDTGLDRTWKGAPEQNPIIIGSEEGLIAIALRATIFTTTRNRLQDSNYTLPENPELRKAVDAIREALEKRPKVKEEFSKLLIHLSGSQSSNPPISSSIRSPLVL